jgi:hypothetical protein
MTYNSTSIAPPQNLIVSHKHISIPVAKNFVQANQYHVWLKPNGELLIVVLTTYMYAHHHLQPIKKVFEISKTVYFKPFFK